MGDKGFCACARRVSEAEGIRTRTTPSTGREEGVPSRRFAQHSLSKERTPAPARIRSTHTHKQQFLYVLVGGKFPFNAFLASFLGHVSFFALTLALRQQLDPATAPEEFPGLAPERAVADYVLANLGVLLAVWNYLG